MTVPRPPKDSLKWPKMAKITPPSLNAVVDIVDVVIVVTVVFVAVVGVVGGVMVTWPKTIKYKTTTTITTTTTTTR